MKPILYLKKIIRIVLSNESDLMKYTICKTDFLTLRVHRIKREAVLIFIYSMMVLLLCKYESFWQEVMEESLILRWSLRPVGLLFYDVYVIIAANLNPSLGVYGFWTERDLYSATPAVTRDLGFRGLVLKIVIFSCLLKQVRTGDLF